MAAPRKFTPYAYALKLEADRAPDPTPASPARYLTLHPGKNQSCRNRCRNSGYVANTARNVARRYKSAGIEHAIHDLPRPGSERLLDVRQEAAVIAMVCSKPPEGFARWSISLIAKEAILREIIDSVSEDTIGRILKRHELKPWREKNVVRRED